MKTLLILAALTAPLFARELTVAWDANPEPDVAGYKLTITTGDKSREIDVPAATEVTADLQPGDVLRVRAYNVLGFEGPNSDPLTIGGSPSKPGALRVRHTIELQQSNNLGEWETIATVGTYDSAGAQAFWRTKNP